MYRLPDHPGLFAVGRVSSGVHPPHHTTSYEQPQHTGSLTTLRYTCSDGKAHKPTREERTTTTLYKQGTSRVHSLNTQATLRWPSQRGPTHNNLRVLSPCDRLRPALPSPPSSWGVRLRGLSFATQSSRYMHRSGGTNHHGRRH